MPPPPSQPGERERERDLFGVEFPWGRGTLTAGGESIGPIGIRDAGNASYMASAGGLKRPFVLDLDRFEGLAFSGLTETQLKTGALDPSKAREAFAFALFREAGVPAPRTGIAEVSLSAPGLHDRALLGLYTLVEPVRREDEPR